MSITATAKYPKATFSREDVERQRQLELDAGADSATISEKGSDYILTTVWPEIGQ